jgi:hypothetical protein
VATLPGFSPSSSSSPASSRRSESQFSAWERPHHRRRPRRYLRSQRAHLTCPGRDRRPCRRVDHVACGVMIRGNRTPSRVRAEPDWSGGQVLGSPRTGESVGRDGGRPPVRLTGSADPRRRFQTGDETVCLTLLAHVDGNRSVAASLAERGDVELPAGRLCARQCVRRRA